MRNRFLAALAPIALPLLLAQPAAGAELNEAAPARISALVVYGNDPCPNSKDDEIVVCARQPENERYRIPRELRKKKPEPAAQSWVARARTLDMVSRLGTPDSCSPQGSGGQTGCFRQFQELARQEREAQKAQAADQP
jgi:hypothetical protein